MDLNKLDKQQLIELVGQILCNMTLSVPAPVSAEPGAGLPAVQGGWLVGSLAKEAAVMTEWAQFHDREGPLGTLPDGQRKSENDRRPLPWTSSSGSEQTNRLERRVKPRKEPAD